MIDLTRPVTLRGRDVSSDTTREFCRFSHTKSVTFFVRSHDSFYHFTFTELIMYAEDNTRGTVGHPGRRSVGNDPISATNWLGHRNPPRSGSTPSVL